MLTSTLSSLICADTSYCVHGICTIRQLSESSLPSRFCACFYPYIGPRCNKKNFSVFKRIMEGDEYSLAALSIISAIFILLIIIIIVLIYCLILYKRKRNNPINVQGKTFMESCPQQIQIVCNEAHVQSPMMGTPSFPERKFRTSFDDFKFFPLNDEFQNIKIPRKYSDRNYF
uniref:Epidermal growth factor Smed-egf-2 n=1 Tax=Schmidtea mediterranea TaxID=79327 RepID=A0A1B1ACX5_SCHMD|nr:epidermal growth factor Smed-egf-2 [Schmidtea mediterranea]